MGIKISERALQNASVLMSRRRWSFLVLITVVGIGALMSAGIVFLQKDSQRHRSAELMLANLKVDAHELRNYELLEFDDPKDSAEYNQDIAEIRARSEKTLQHLDRLL